jgi:hypothetical protein
MYVLIADSLLLVTFSLNEWIVAIGKRPCDLVKEEWPSADGKKSKKQESESDE